MNQQIQELAAQCGFRSNPDVYDRNQSFDIDKFAKLILDECLDICQRGTQTQTTCDGVATLIKLRFGIKND